MIKIGNIKIKYPVILAPMAGITDHPYRIICKRMGASIVYTEFVSAEGIIRENLKTLEMIKFTDEERPIGVQIFGDKPEVVAKSAKYINENFNPDIIDINYGCPVPKITKRGAGSAALKDLGLMKEISTAVRENVNNIPVTAKIRAGWDSNNIVAIEAGLLLQEIGVNAITLHARTTKQGFTGLSDWKIIKDLKNELYIPVIGNGDVKNVNDYINMIKYTKCDAVMIGRGALGNPWIFRDIVNHINNINHINISITDKINLCLYHISLLEKHKNEIACINLSKKHINFYIKNFDKSSDWRKKIMRMENINDIRIILNEMLLEY